MGSEYAWALAFAVPYIAVFFAFVIYPICYGLWLGSEPAALQRTVRRSPLPDRRASTR